MYKTVSLSSVAGIRVVKSVNRQFVYWYVCVL